MKGQNLSECLGAVGIRREKRQASISVAKDIIWTEEGAVGPVRKYYNFQSHLTTFSMPRQPSTDLFGLGKCGHGLILI